MFCRLDLSIRADNSYVDPALLLVAFKIGSNVLLCVDDSSYLERSICEEELIYLLSIRKFDFQHSPFGL